MSRIIVPISKLNYPVAFSLDADEIFAKMGAHEDDQFTYTFRVSVDNPQRREQIRAALSAVLEPDEFIGLTQFLEDNGWDVSFLADTF